MREHKKVYKDVIYENFTYISDENLLITLTWGPKICNNNSENYFYMKLISQSWTDFKIGGEL